MLYFQKNFGTINTKSPIEENVEDLEKKEWDKEKVLELFTKLRFNKYIDRFSLRNEEKEINPFEEIEIIENLSKSDIENLTKEIEKNKEIIYYIDTKEDEKEENIIKKDIASISIIIENKVYYIENKEIIIEDLKNILENKNINKIGYKLKQDYILLKQIGITLNNFYYDIEIAGYIIDSIKNKYDIETLSLRYLNLEISRFTKKEEKTKQLDLFSMQEETNEEEKNKACVYAYVTKKLYEATKKMIEDEEELDLFQNIEMKSSEVLAKMQYTGIEVDKEELIEFGRKLKLEIEEKTNKIYNLCSQEFNINSTKQLGKVLFEDLKLPVQKKKKSRIFNRCRSIRKIKRRTSSNTRIIRL